jgi:acyl-CoA thioesterase
MRPPAGTYRRGVDDVQRAALEVVLLASSFRSTLGASVATWGGGAAEVELVPDAGLLNLGGTVHGGVLACLADLAFEVACNSWGRQVVATGLSLHYAVASPPGAPLVATARELTRSRRIASYEVVVRAEEATVAWAQATAYRTDGWHLGEAAWTPQWRREH